LYILTPAINIQAKRLTELDVYLILMPL